MSLAVLAKESTGTAGGKAKAASARSERDGVPARVREVFHSPGQPLDPETRAYFEPRFGHDFGRVRVHTDAKAAASARSVNALACTVGEHIVFASPVPATNSSDWRRLLGHELVHVLQQLQGTHLPPRAARISQADQRAHEWEAEQIPSRLSSGGAPTQPVHVSPSPTTMQRQAGGGASCQDVQACADRLLAALDKNDGTEVSVVLSEMAHDASAASLRQLVVDLDFRGKLRTLAPGSTLFTILRRLWFPTGPPAAVQQFEEALRSRNGGMAVKAVQQSPDLRDPEKVPGVYDSVNKVFAGTPEYASLMKLLSWDIGEVLQIGRQSARFRALEAAARGEARQSGEELSISKGAPGETETRAGYVLIQPDVKSPQDAVIRLSHELANKAAEPEFARVRERRDNNEFKSATEYSEAMLSVEADSVIQRAEVAVELNISENPTVEALVRDMRAHKIGRDEVYQRVLADVKANYKGPGGVPAMEVYEKLFRDWQQLMHK